MAYLIKTDGSIIKDVKIDTLEDKQKLVGGYIEYVYRDDYIYIANEDGIPLNLDFNPLASSVCGQLLVGDVVRALRSEIND